MVKIKICGITNLQDAQDAIRAGCDAVGFVFYKKSPRYIAPRKARAIISRLPRRINKVGVFVNARESTVKRIARFCGLDMLQFHGDESPRFCGRFKSCRVIKAFRVKKSLDFRRLASYNTYAYLFDACARSKFGGSGRQFDWKLLKGRRGLPGAVILSGGLSADNVRKAVKIVAPDWVDVSSSVEAFPGKKEYRKMTQFIQAVKRHLVLCVVILAAAVQPAFSDAIYLKDGRKISGKIIEQTVQKVRIKVMDNEFSFNASDIESIEAGGEEPVQVLLSVEKPPVAETAPAAPQDQARDNAVPASPENLIRLALELSGIERRIKEIPSYVTAELLRNKDMLDPGVYAQAGKLISSCYQPDDLYQALINRLNTKADKEQFRRLLEKLRTPAIKKVFRAQEDARKPEAAPAKADFIARLELYQPTQERVDLLQKLDLVTAASELDIKMQLLAFRDCLSALNLCYAPERRTPPEAIDASVNATRTKLLAASHNSVFISSLFTYRDISEEELKEYLAFYESPLGKWFLKSTEEFLLYGWGVAETKIAQAVVPPSPEEAQPQAK
jgi:phosphoribosylanthranilate isomerase